jgi:hypothetical protein
MKDKLALIPIVIALVISSCKGEAPSASLEMEQQRPSLGAAGKEIPGSCLPGMRVVPDGKHSFRDGSWDYLFNIILVGCGDELERLTSADEKLIIGLAEDSIRREGPHLIAKYGESSFRDSFLKSINKSLGGPVVADVYFNLLMTGEYM